MEHKAFSQSLRSMKKKNDNSGYSVHKIDKIKE